MKVFNRIIIAVEVLCAIGLIWCIINFYNPGVQPNDILSAVNLNLPNYEVKDKEDNLDRGSSRFDNFTYYLTFSSNDAPSLVKKMQRENWERANEGYLKSVVIDEDLTYTVWVNPQYGVATLDVLIDEDYSLIYLVYALGIIMIAILTGVIWGSVKLFNKIKKR